MRVLAPLVAFALTLSVGCNNSDFSGGGDQAPEKSKSEPDENASPGKKTKPQTSPEPASGTSSNPDAADDSHATASAPARAVKDGRFKAWSEPAAPLDKQDYQLFIQMTLPPNVNPQSVAKTDLSGLVKGSDGFEFRIEKAFELIPGPIPIAVPFDPRGKFEVKGNVATLSFFVPYAPRHASDTLSVHSNVLNEDASLTVEFQ